MTQLRRPEAKLTLRLATKADLDDITKVAQAGFPDDPEFDYRFPERKKYPEDNWKWTRQEYEEYIDQPEKFAVLVVTAPVESDGETANKPISLAVWDMSVLTNSKGGNLGIDSRRDVNKRHFKEFAKTLDEAFNKYFSKYGKKQYHLWLLATHPDFRGQGAGTMLCKWGMEKAREKDYMATVLGSSMGKNLYEHLCFDLLGSVTVQVDDEDEKLTVYCLEYKKSD
ncbi:acyl-CoA N-acyltransferase [Mytilinidion resinicola]|uniref:Acyl-CoA N-acyltransferase n=1 Tax=Mytilinidion resinicola TaxID=574789 RepID=A0A6A6YSC7_9PEZI|nr:acyl-CoA N-acyltransferase [Mytilinidion resinicola]KAF2810817.1 acyl-CoA N-acyltransferase [Mytilinidion resinicola]